MALACMPDPTKAAELDRLGDEIAELAAHLDAATARLLALIHEFDARGGWSNGFLSCAHWLNWRVGLGLGAAREHVRVARALATLPALAGALGRGEVSYAKVRALTRVATPETEARLLVVGRSGTAAHVERIVRGWRQVDRREEAREGARRHRARGLTVTHDADGMVVVHGRFEPEVGALLLRALEAAGEILYRRSRTGPPPLPTPGDPLSEPPSRPQRQADALALIAEAALRHELDPGPPGARYQVVVHVDASVLAEPVDVPAGTSQACSGVGPDVPAGTSAAEPGQALVEGGARISADTSRRLACDASRVVMRQGPEGETLDVGRRTRVIPPAIRRALLHRDRGCRFPGCHIPAGQGHHLRHWAHGGPTSLANLVLLCRRHHRAVHEEGYRVDRGPDGDLRFQRPDGQPLPPVPPAPAVPADPAGTLTTQHHAQGIRPDARTACPRWYGERLDIGYAIDVLRPRAG